jgi:dolichol-phosphate mannosyltransferase
MIRRVADEVVIPVHLVHRDRGERAGGLAGVVRAGMAVARCRHVCVIDCAEHAPEEIPALVAAAASNGADLVVGGSSSRLFLVRRGSVDLEGLRARGSRLVRELIRRSPDLRVAQVSAPVKRTTRVPRSAWRAAAARS